MTWDEAIKSVQEGNFISNKNFSSNESIHEWNEELVYEDGTILSGALINIMHEEDWSKDGWYIKYTKEQVDRNKLERLHKEFKGYTLSGKNRSYEECIRK